MGMFDQPSSIFADDQVGGPLANLLANYLGNVFTGQIAANGVLSGGNYYDPNRSFAQNALDPRAIENAANIGLGFSGGGLGLKDDFAAKMDQLARLRMENEGLAPNIMESGTFFQNLQKPPGIRAYHGSPYDFDAFDAAKIGTGEGAQAYGHGLYFAEAEPVARNYRDAGGARNMMIAGQPFTPGNYEISQIVGQNADDLGAVADLLHSYMIRSKGNPYAANEDAAAIIRAIDNKQFDPGSPGRMYEVNINADPNAFLDWDKPLRE